MKGFIETLKNIWKIEELRNKIMLTLGLILIYRIGSFIILPGVDLDRLSASGGAGGGLGELISLFTGGAFSRASIFALGIMPYISASIIMQLLGIAVPSIQKMQKEGESGRKKINGAVVNPGILWWTTSIVLLVSGTLFVMWLGERITEKGIGNGISLLIMIGIIAQFPSSFVTEVISQTGAAGGGWMLLLIEIVVLLLVIAACVALVQGVRRIPVQFAKRVVGNKQYGGVRQYLPIKVNAAGVMPIIFAQALMFVPYYFAEWLEAESFAANWALDGFWYNVTFFLLVVVFTYFYTAITVNPNQMADDLKRNGGFIPGVKPGRKTTEFLDEILSRVTLPGAIFLGIIAILPAFAMMAGVKQGFAMFYGGTSLLIMVGVVLDTLQQIESHLISRHYDGLMKSGSIKGRGGNSFYGMAG